MKLAAIAGALALAAAGLFGAGASKASADDGYVPSHHGCVVPHHAPRPVPPHHYVPRHHDSHHYVPQHRSYVPRHHDRHPYVPQHHYVPRHHDGPRHPYVPRRHYPQHHGRRGWGR